MPLPMFQPQKSFADLDEREILALAITLEEEDGRIYRDYAEGLRAEYPASAAVFERMAEEESRHRRMLLDLYRQKFGQHIPLLRREDVRGFVRRRPLWLTRPLGIEAVRRQAEELEAEVQTFYRRAAEHVSDVGIRRLLVDLAEAEEETERRRFVLQVIQPGLAGLMDGSVSTLAPLFAAPSPPAAVSHGCAGWSAGR